MNDSTRLFIALALATFAVVLFEGCSIPNQLCNRLDECNYLDTSVDECVDIVEDAYDDMSNRNQEDFEDDMDECLDYSSCERFLDCFTNGGSSSCSNTCQFANDGECDDGGPGSDYDLCDYGTDCGDCGPR